MNLIYFDLETTSLKIDTCEIIQLGAIIQDLDKKKKEKNINTLFKNDKEKISYSAQAIHNIREDKLKKKKIFSNKTKEYKMLEGFVENSIFITHNGFGFDYPIIERYGINIKYKIDTLKISRFILNENESEELDNKYNLNVLKYYFLDKGYYKVSELENLVAHDAFGDVVVLKLIFKALYDMINERLFGGKGNKKEIITKMINISNNPIKIKVMPFGKYSGNKISDIPSSSLFWYLNNIKDLSEDLRYSIVKVLKENGDIIE